MVNSFLPYGTKEENNFKELRRSSSKELHFYCALEITFVKSD